VVTSNYTTISTTLTDTISLGLECYAAAFRENAVSAVVLPTQTADDQVPSRLAIAVRS
jgi:hypothetical protein